MDGLKKTAMPIQDGKIRCHNLKEVTLGYTKEMALNEASRCLNCQNKPCVKGCPVKIDIPSFIQAIKREDFAQAFQIIKENSSLPAICGRVCPQENQCEKHCIRGIKGESVAIGRLERFVADWAMEHKLEEEPNSVFNHHKVAIIGSGPAGLACAGDLVKKGYDVTIFEALHTAGGVLVYGIPEFRLPKQIVEKEINSLKKSGVQIICNHVIGKTEMIDELFDQGYEAVFIATGAGLPNFMKLPGENLNGVYSANEYLTRFNLMKAYQEDSMTPIHKASHVVVVGGGNVAMDAARCARRLGCENVTIVYRRSMEELPARKEEVEHAMEEGIAFKLLSNPVKIVGEKGWVQAVECATMQLGEPDESGRRKPQIVENANFIIEADCVIMAIGTSPNPLIKMTTTGLEVNHKGCILIDESGKTTLDRVYAGGDAVSGAATVIQAMGAGKKAAESIDKLFRK